MNVAKIHSIPDGVFSPGILWNHRILYPKDTIITSYFSREDLNYFERAVGPQMSAVAEA